ncbi:MAG TPA: RNA 2',3'-cyclic phosphodiesterase [Hyphomicrobium sp.]|nr:RNA 2',3'-cyclic phosphodiesterase [Hyphomicrobium sp.]
MPRLFTAIEIPEDICDELYRLHQPLPGARWIQPCDYHLTLRFAGDVDNLIAREFAANLASVDVDAFELTISGLGAFGGNDPRSIWAGVAPCPALDILARAHEKAARNAGLAPDKREFKPHVTLARLNSSNPEAVARFLTRYSGYRSEPFFVAQAVLMSAKPSVGGGPYAIEERFPLRGGLYIGDESEASW